MKTIRLLLTLLFFFSIPVFGAVDSSNSEMATASITPQNVYRAILGGVADYAVFEEATVPIDNALSSMFWVFNISVFIVLSWLLFAIMMQKLLVAGNDGQIQSNKYNDTMAIVRAAGSLCGLLPVIKGFCLAQVLVAFMGLQASFIADEVNEAGNEFTFVNGATTPYSADPIKVNNLVRSIFNSVTCAVASNNYYNEHPRYNQKYAVQLKDISNETSHSSNTAYFKYAYENGEGDQVCGSVEMAVNDDQYLGSMGDPTGTFGIMSPTQIQLRNRIVDAHKSAVQQTHNFLINGISIGVVVPGEDVDMGNLQESYRKAKLHYHRSLSQALTESSAQMTELWNSEMEAQFQTKVTSFAAKRGWIYNGFTWIEKSRAESFMSKLSSQVPNGQAINYNELEDEFVKERLNRALSIIKTSIINNTFNAKRESGNTSDQLSSESLNELQALETDKLMQAFYKEADFESVTSKISSSVVKSTLYETQFNFKDYDPITNLQHLGYRMVTVGFQLVALAVTLDVANEALAGEGSDDTWVRWGINQVSGGVSESLIRGASALAGNVVEGLFSLAPLLIAVGSVLAYWLPALPFFMWDLAVLGNYLLVLIAFMAAPLWMAAHAMPEGDGFSGDHARQAPRVDLGRHRHPRLLRGRQPDAAGAGWRNAVPVPRQRGARL